MAADNGSTEHPIVAADAAHTSPPASPALSASPSPPASPKRSFAHIISNKAASTSVDTLKRSPTPTPYNSSNQASLSPAEQSSRDTSVEPFDGEDEAKAPLAEAAAAGQKSWSESLLAKLGQSPAIMSRRMRNSEAGVEGEDPWEDEEEEETGSQESWSSEGEGEDMVQLVDEEGNPLRHGDESQIGYRSALQQYRRSRRALMRSEYASHDGSEIGAVHDQQAEERQAGADESPPEYDQEGALHDSDTATLHETIDANGGYGSAGEAQHSEEELLSADEGTASPGGTGPSGRASERDETPLPEPQTARPRSPELSVPLDPFARSDVPPSPEVPPPMQRAPSTPPTSPPQPHQQQHQQASNPAPPPHSLWDYLKEEVLATDFDSTQELKWERVTNFIAIPFWMEKIILFGFFVCLDSFLYTFTILPLRFGVALYFWAANSLRWIAGGERRYLHSSHKCDLLKTALILSSCFILSRLTDASIMYHSIRGQGVIKLSVIFNVLEIADKLCCSFGQDLLDSLFSRSTLARRKDGRQPYLRPAGFFLLSLAYILAHTFVLFYQLVTLNVAIMAYDESLLTLLLSNQFVEIKGSVFKKFEKENLFQITCADIVERFQLTLMLTAIGLRNLIEVAGITAGIDGGTGPLPTSFTVFPSLNMLENVVAPVAIVLASECIVDWLKHAFITKFNHIRPSVYGRFMDVLCRDLVVTGPASGTAGRKHTFVDQSPIVSRRLGFAALPLACLLVRITSQVLGMLRDTSHFDECAAPHAHNHAASSFAAGFGFARLAARAMGASDPEGAVNHVAEIVVQSAAWFLTIVVAWVFLVGLKLLLGTNLVSFASYRYATMLQREHEEELNARDRAPIGMDEEERAYEKKIVQLVDKPEYNAGSIGLRGQQPPVTSRPAANTGGGGEKKGSLMDIHRYSMVKSRIW